MKKNSFGIGSRGLLLCVVALMTMLLTAQTPAEELVNPFLQEGQWYKAALHVHSTTSDGDVAVSERVKQYREKSYDVVAVTDHWKTNKIDGLSDETFLVINGMEAHPAGNHFVCLNLPEDIQIKQDMKPQEVIDIVNAAGGSVIYAHPYWLGHTIEEMRSVNGYIGIEIYNAVCELGKGKGFAEVHWDQLLGKGVILPAVAADDVHSSKNVGIGWTMIKAKELTAGAIMTSLKTGCYYASCGPVIEDFRMEEGVAKIKCSPAARIRFVGPKAHGAVKNAKDGQLLTTAEWTLPKGCNFVRAEVTDPNGNQAWTNPIVLK